MKNIITIQHTQSIHHINGMIGSWTDWDLSELGIQQATRIGERLSQELDGKQYIMYSSDLLRTKHTAEIVAGYLGVNPILTEALREMNLGEAVGKSREWAQANTLGKIRTIDDRSYNGAESIRDVWNRLAAFHEQLMASADDCMIIVSHGGTLGIFHALWLGVEVDALNKFDFTGKAGGVSFMRENADGKRIVDRLYDPSYIRSIP